MLLNVHHSQQHEFAFLSKTYFNVVFHHHRFTLLIRNKQHWQTHKTFLDHPYVFMKSKITPKLNDLMS